MRFTIRDLLWLTVVVALAIALVVERNRNETLGNELTVVSDRLAKAEKFLVDEGWVIDWGETKYPIYRVEVSF